MKKNTKIIIAMSSVIVVLGVVLGVILAQPSENSSENANENTDILLFDKSSLDVDDACFILCRDMKTPSCQST